MLAANNGCTNAMYYYHIMLKNGDNVPIDNHNLIVYLNKNNYSLIRYYCIE